MPSIVQLNVSLTSAPTPNNLQRMGAFISQGATTLPAGQYSLLTQTADLTPLLAPPLSLASLIWSAGVVVGTSSAPIPGLTNGETFIATIAGASPAGFNGTFLVTVTGTNTFTYALAVNPGASSASGTFTPPNQGELLAMSATFFGQGTSRSVYVLELGAGDGNSGPTALGTWIGTNPNFFYSFLVPRSWDATANFLALANQFLALTAKQFFFVTTTPSTYQNYTAQQNDIWALIEAPGIPLTEFSCAAAFQASLSYAPSNTNRMTPFAFTFLFGVTPYPLQGNSALLTTLKNANVNVVGTGAEGGISNTLIQWGTTMDGRDFAWWYSVDWFQINSQQSIANAVINGSNSPTNPLDYDQDGVNRLQDTVVGTVKNAITFGCATGNVGRSALDGPAFTEALDDGDFVNTDVVNAVPFKTYAQANPGNYKQGIYGGLTAVFIPFKGFTQIIFNINVTDLISE